MQTPQPLGPPSKTHTHTRHHTGPSTRGSTSVDSSFVCSVFRLVLAQTLPFTGTRSSEGLSAGRRVLDLWFFQLATASSVTTAYSHIPSYFVSANLTPSFSPPSQRHINTPSSLPSTWIPPSTRTCPLKAWYLLPTVVLEVPTCWQFLVPAMSCLYHLLAALALTTTHPMIPPTP